MGPKKTRAARAKQVPQPSHDGSSDDDVPVRSAPPVIARPVPRPPQPQVFGPGLGSGHHVFQQFGRPEHASPSAPTPLPREIYEAGMFVRGLTPRPLQFPMAEPPITLGGQYQQPAQRSSHGSAQGAQREESPSSVEQGGGSQGTTTEGEAEGVRKGRGTHLFKTEEFDFPQMRCRISVTGQSWIIEREHEKIKKHGDVVGEIGAVVSSDYPGEWYKMPAPDQQVDESPNGNDHGYVHQTQIKKWMHSLSLRFTWPKNQRELVLQKFQKTIARKVQSMIYEARNRDPAKAKLTPKWAGDEQWKNILEKISHDYVYMKVCEMNKQNRGKSATHGSGRRRHVERLAELRKKKGRSLRVAERFRACYGKKDAAVPFDENTPLSQVVVVDSFKTRMSEIIEACIIIFGDDEKEWPDDAAERAVAYLKTPVYHGYVPGFPDMTPADVSKTRRRRASGSIHIDEMEEEPANPPVQTSAPNEHMLELISMIANPTGDEELDARRQGALEELMRMNAQVAENRRKREEEQRAQFATQQRLLQEAAAQRFQHDEQMRIYWANMRAGAGPSGAGGAGGSGFGGDGAFGAGGAAGYGAGGFGGAGAGGAPTGGVWGAGAGGAPTGGVWGAGAGGVGGAAAAGVWGAGAGGIWGAGAGGGWGASVVTPTGAVAGSGFGGAGGGGDGAAGVGAGGLVAPRGSGGFRSGGWDAQWGGAAAAPFYQPNMDAVTQPGNVTSQIDPRTGHPYGHLAPAEVDALMRMRDDNPSQDDEETD